MPKEGLTEKQERFCREYMIDFNATQAYKRAGYSAKSDIVAASEGFKLLRKPKIETRLSELKEIQNKRLDFKADDVMKQIKSIVMFNPQKLFDNNGQLKKITDLDEETALAISSIDTQNILDGDIPATVTKLRAWDKIRAISEAAKIFKMYEDKPDGDTEDDNLEIDDWA